MKYSLYFERFLNPERVSMPDIDVDFCYRRRGEVIDYVNRKYGADHVAQIVTFGTMAAKGAIRDVGRALNVPYARWTPSPSRRGRSATPPTCSTPSHRPGWRRSSASGPGMSSVFFANGGGEPTRA